MTPLLEVENLQVHFESREGTVRALRGVDFTLLPGETLALVGESGCGKSMTARAVLNMVPRPGRIVGGRVIYHRVGGTPLELSALSPGSAELRAVRGGQIAMIFQEPMTSFSPVYTIGNQIVEAVLLHSDLDKRDARERAASLLERVGIPDPNRCLESYAFELSGGMRQRAMIAMALSSDPQILIADEPTTALDVTIQAQILGLLQSLSETHGMSMLFITHNLGVVANIASRVAVMYLGRVVEEAPAEELFSNPQHPYTRGLLASVPKPSRRERGGRAPLTAIRGTVPHPLQRVSGCAFHPRCDAFMEGVCEVLEPELLPTEGARRVRCHLYTQSEERQ